MAKYMTQDNVSDIFGKITPVGPMTGDPIAELGKLIAFGIRMVILIAGILVLVYLFWGAFDWISSAGEKEKLAKAQKKIFDAIIGIVIIFVAISLWGLITGNILGIIINTPNGWIINLPTF